jgi:hypothetical protein
VHRRVAGNKFSTGDPEILGAGVQNSVAGATWLPGFGIMTELVPSYQIRLFVYSGNPITLLHFPPILKEEASFMNCRSISRHFQFTTRIFSGITRVTKPFFFFKNLTAGRVT